MNTIQRIAKNTIFLASSNIIGFIFSFFFLVYTTRYLGSEGYGLLSFAIAFASISIFLADMGITSVIVRDVARDRSKTATYIGNSILIKLVLAAITLLATAAIGFILGYPFSTMKIVMVILLSLIVVSFSGIISSVISAYEIMEYISIGTVIYNSIMLTFALLAIGLEVDVYGFAYVYLLSSFFSLGYYALVAYRRFPRPRWDIDLDLWKYIIREAIPFGLSSVFVRVYYYIDTVMISLLILNPNEVMGWYNAAYRMVIILSFIPVTFLGSLYPIMSKLYVSSDKYLGFMYERSFKYLMILAIPIGVGTTVLGEDLISIVYGPDFAPSAIALRILIWSEVLIFINSSFGYLFNSINRQMIVAKQTMLAAGFNILLNLFLIPQYSYIGASSATVATQLLSFFFLLHFASKEGYGLPKDMAFSFIKISIACLIMTHFIEVLDGLSIPLLISISAAIYFILIFLFRVIDDVDIQMAKQLIGGLKAPGGEGGD
ncbi:oligosaccharide flippase family protein [Methanothrix sp.]|uniref:oligosaccharide flippase family protein n=1 Tax=Methanothrix sp. TaxID=90426 RepID=UPI003C71F156